ASYPIPELAPVIRMVLPAWSGMSFVVQSLMSSLLGVVSGDRSIHVRSI
ncbi:MAG: hypothetical protein ACI9CV_000816, partial [Ilumatobacter sp.]